METQSAPLKEMLRLMQQLQRWMHGWKKSIHCVKCLVRREKRRLNEIRGRKNDNLCKTPQSVAHSVQPPTPPPTRVLTAQSVMRHETKTTDGRGGNGATVEPREREREEWEEVLCVFYLTVSRIEPRHRLWCGYFFSGGRGGDGCAR